VTPIDKNNEPLDTILRRAMRAEPGPATPECADAESLAAYSDRSLATAHRERLEAHFADCMRCQVLLADIARADESARGARAESAVPWYRKWRVAIPAFAAVAAVVIFVAMRRPVNEGAPPTDQIAAISKNEAPRADFAAEEPASAPAAPAPPTAALASNAIAMNEPKTVTAPRAEAFGGALLSRMAASGAAPAGGSAGAMTAKAAAPQAAAGGMMSSDAAIANARVFVTIATPDRSVMWLVGAGGLIRRMSPHGTQVQQSGVSSDLLAGAAPSATVCWVVGKKGTIIRTIDGEHWQTVTAPTADDLKTVTASSADDAMITTAGGKRFATSDGGASWHANQM
jgi:hypothetical protein